MRVTIEVDGETYAYADVEETGDVTFVGPCCGEEHHAKMPPFAEIPEPAKQTLAALALCDCIFKITGQDREPVRPRAMAPDRVTMTRPRGRGRGGR